MHGVTTVNGRFPHLIRLAIALAPDSRLECDGQTRGVRELALGDHRGYMRQSIWRTVAVG